MNSFSSSMYDWPDAPERRDVIKISTFQVAVALSILLHILVLWQWLPHMRAAGPGAAEHADTPLTVHLAPPPSPPAPRVAQVRPPHPVAPPPKVTPQPPVVETPPKAPVLALNKPAPAPTPAPADTPPPKRAQTTEDFAAFVEARRRARGEPAAEPAASAEDENRRASRIAAMNLAPPRTQAFGYDPSKAGGVFEVTSKSYDYAEFVFFGWNRDVRRNTSQLIEVRKGDNPSIELAIVRKMIEIIRTYEQNDFRWESHRLGRTLLLSARTRDTEGLEDFLMREFFGRPR